MRRHARRAAAVIVAALMASGIWFFVVYLMVCGFARSVE